MQRVDAVTKTVNRWVKFEYVAEGISTMKFADYEYAHLQAKYFTINIFVPVRTPGGSSSKIAFYFQDVQLLPNFLTANIAPTISYTSFQHQFSHIYKDGEISIRKLTH